MNITLTGIHAYPLKAAAGLDLEATLAQRRGLAHDRRWMVVDSEGIFLSQRQHPRLALISPTLGDRGELTLRAPEMPALVVPVPPADRERIRVQIWRDHVRVAPGGQRADTWLSRFLDLDCRLVHLPDDVRRRVDVAHARPGDHVSLADGFPYLLTTEDSLADLNTRLAANTPGGAPVPMARFRPNLVVRGAPPFAEDGWRRFRIGEVAFRVAKPCSRCSVITVDQQTARCGQEPLRTLATYRQWDGKVWFGINLVAENAGRLRVGDALVLRD